MAPAVNTRFLLAALLAGLILILMSPRVEANRGRSNPEGWIDKLTGFVLIQRGIETEGDFDLYLKQLEVVRSAFRRESKHGHLRDTYANMNIFMDMLEAKLGSIRTEAANAIWDFCNEVTPIALHDVERHRRGFGVTYPERLVL